MARYEIKAEKLFEIKFVEKDGKKFYYVEIGLERHWPENRMWLNIKDFNDNVTNWYWGDSLALKFPIKNATIIQGKKNLILKRNNGTNVFDVFVPCGYRGRVPELEILSDIVFKYEYVYYHSGKGNLGISRGALVVTDKDYVEFKYRRTGRLYGEPESELVKIYLDGKVENVLVDQDEFELIEQELSEE